MTRLGAPLQALTDVFRNPDLGRLQLAWAGVSFAMWAFAIALGVSRSTRRVRPPSASPAGPGASRRPRLPFRRPARRSSLHVVGAHLAARSRSPCARARGARGRRRRPAWSVFALAGLFTVVLLALHPRRGGIAATARVHAAGALGRERRPQRHGQLGFLGGSILTGVLLAFTSVEAVFAAAAMLRPAACPRGDDPAPTAAPITRAGVDAGGVIRRPRPASGRCSPIPRCGCSGAA